MLLARHRRAGSSAITDPRAQILHAQSVMKDPSIVQKLCSGGSSDSQEPEYLTGDERHAREQQEQRAKAREEYAARVAQQTPRAA